MEGALKLVLAQELDAALWALDVDAAGATPAVEACLHELDGHLSFVNSILSTGLAASPLLRSHPVLMHTCIDDAGAQQRNA